MRHRWGKSELRLRYWKILSTASTNVPRRSKTGLDSLKPVEAKIATTHFPTSTVYLAIFGFATLSINFYHFKSIFCRFG